MDVNAELVKKVASLARLQLAADEQARYAKELQEIISAFSILKEADVGDVQSAFRPVEVRNRLREDAVSKCLTQEEALQFVQHSKAGFIVGPKVIEG